VIGSVTGSVPAAVGTVVGEALTREVGADVRRKINGGGTIAVGPTAESGVALSDAIRLTGVGVTRIGLSVG